MSDDVSLAIGDRGAASFLLAFAVTQLVEVPIYLRALRDRRPSPPQGATDGTGAKGPAEGKSTWIARASIAFGASAITHPIVWFVMPWAATALYRIALRAGAPALGELGRTLLYGALAEGFAVLVEGLYLRGFGVKRAMIWSISANAASVVVGTLAVRLL